MAYPEAMQFGRALERILYQIRYANPKFGHVHLGKVDLADGFYRLRLAISSIMKLGVEQASQVRKGLVRRLVCAAGWSPNRRPREGG